MGLLFQTPGTMAELARYHTSHTLRYRPQTPIAEVASFRADNTYVRYRRCLVACLARLPPVCPLCVFNFDLDYACSTFFHPEPIRYALHHTGLALQVHHYPMLHVGRDEVSPQPADAVHGSPVCCL